MPLDRPARVLVRSGVVAAAMTVLIETPSGPRRILEATAEKFGLRYGDFVEGFRLLNVVQHDIALRRRAAEAMEGGTELEVLPGNGRG